MHFIFKCMLIIQTPTLENWSGRGVSEEYVNIKDLLIIAFATATDQLSNNFKLILLQSNGEGTILEIDR